eukprot:8994351-Heterocapsa_arctica.AAC.1
MPARRHNLHGLPAVPDILDERRPSALEVLMRPRVQEPIHIVATRPGFHGDDHGYRASYAYARRQGNSTTESPQILAVVRAPHDLSLIHI